MVGESQRKNAITLDQGPQLIVSVPAPVAVPRRITSEGERTRLLSDHLSILELVESEHGTLANLIANRTITISDLDHLLEPLLRRLGASAHLAARFVDECEILRREVASVRELLRNNPANHERISLILGTIQRQVDTLDDIFGIETSFLLGGIPEEITSAQTGQLFDSFECAFSQMGTTNSRFHERAQAILELGRRFVEFNQFARCAYLSSDLRGQAAGLRTDLSDHIRRLGLGANSGNIYSEDDEHLCANLQASSNALDVQLVAFYRRLIPSMRDAAIAYANRPADESARSLALQNARRLSQLSDDLLESISESSMMTISRNREIDAIVLLYQQITGSHASDLSVHMDQIHVQARAIRGPMNAREARTPGTAQWYADQALRILDDPSNINERLVRADLALDTARALSSHIIIPTQTLSEIRDAIGGTRRANTDVLTALHLLGRLDDSVIGHELGALGRIYPAMRASSVNAETPPTDRIAVAALHIHERINAIENGDFSGLASADRLLEMIRLYTRLWSSMPNHDWAGRQLLTQAIDAENSGDTSSAARFYEQSVNLSDAYERVLNERNTVRFACGSGVSTQARMLDGNYTAALRILVNGGPAAVDSASELLGMTHTMFNLMLRYGVLQNNVLQSVDREFNFRALQIPLEDFIRANDAAGRTNAMNIFDQRYYVQLQSYVHAQQTSIGELLTHAPASLRTAVHEELARSIQLVDSLVTPVPGATTNPNHALIVTHILNLVDTAHAVAAQYQASTSRPSSAPAQTFSAGELQLLTAIGVLSGGDITDPNFLVNSQAALTNIQSALRVRYSAHFISNELRYFRMAVDGRVPLLDRPGEVAGEISLPSQNGVPQSIALADVLSYDQNFAPHDRLVPQGRTILALLDAAMPFVERADVDGYLAIRAELMERLITILPRAVNYRNFQTLQSEFADEGSFERGIGMMVAQAAGNPTQAIPDSAGAVRSPISGSPVDSLPQYLRGQLHALEDQRTRLNHNIRTAFQPGSDSTMFNEDVSIFLNGFTRLQRLISQYALIRAEVRANDLYLNGDPTRHIQGVRVSNDTETINNLVESSRHFQFALDAIASGSDPATLANVRNQFEQGLRLRAAAIDHHSIITGIPIQYFAIQSLQEPYINRRMQLYDATLNGTGTLQDNYNRSQAFGLFEASIFLTPPNVLSRQNPAHNQILESQLAILGAANDGNIERATIYSDRRARLVHIDERNYNIAWGLTGLGGAALNPWLGYSIFTGLTYDHLTTEYRQGTLTGNDAALSVGLLVIPPVLGWLGNTLRASVPLLRGGALMAEEYGIVEGAGGSLRFAGVASEEATAAARSLRTAAALNSVAGRATGWAGVGFGGYFAAAEALATRQAMREGDSVEALYHGFMAGFSALGMVRHGFHEYRADIELGPNPSRPRNGPSRGPRRSLEGELAELLDALNRDLASYTPRAYSESPIMRFMRDPAFVRQLVANLAIPDSALRGNGPEIIRARAARSEATINFARLRQANPDIAAAVFRYSQSGEALSDASVARIVNGAAAPSLASEAVADQLLRDLLIPENLPENAPNRNRLMLARNQARQRLYDMSRDPAFSASVPVIQEQLRALSAIRPVAAAAGNGFVEIPDLVAQRIALSARAVSRAFAAGARLDTNDLVDISPRIPRRVTVSRVVESSQSLMEFLRQYRQDIEAGRSNVSFDTLSLTQQSAIISALRDPNLRRVLNNEPVAVTTLRAAGQRVDSLFSELRREPNSMPAVLEASTGNPLDIVGQRIETEGQIDEDIARASGTGGPPRPRSRPAAVANRAGEILGGLVRGVRDNALTQGYVRGRTPTETEETPAQILAETSDQPFEAVAHDRLRARLATMGRETALYREQESQLSEATQRVEHDESDLAAIEQRRRERRDTETRVSQIPGEIAQQEANVNNSLTQTRSELNLIGTQVNALSASLRQLETLLEPSRLAIRARTDRALAQQKITEVRRLITNLNNQLEVLRTSDSHEAIRNAFNQIGQIRAEISQNIAAIPESVRTQEQEFINRTASTDANTTSVPSIAVSNASQLLTDALEPSSGAMEHTEQIQALRTELSTHESVLSREDPIYGELIRSQLALLDQTRFPNNSSQRARMETHIAETRRQYENNLSRREQLLNSLEPILRERNELVLESNRQQETLGGLSSERAGFLATQEQLQTQIDGLSPGENAQRITLETDLNSNQQRLADSTRRLEAESQTLQRINERLSTVTSQCDPLLARLHEIDPLAVQEAQINLRLSGERDAVVIAQGAAIRSYNDLHERFDTFMEILADLQTRAVQTPNPGATQIQSLRNRLYQALISDSTFLTYFESELSAYRQSLTGTQNERPVGLQRQRIESLLQLHHQQSDAATLASRPRDPIADLTDVRTTANIPQIIESIVNIVYSGQPANADPLALGEQFFRRVELIFGPLSPTQRAGLINTYSPEQGGRSVSGRIPLVHGNVLALAWYEEYLTNVARGLPSIPAQTNPNYNPALTDFREGIVARVAQRGQGTPSLLDQPPAESFPITGEALLTYSLQNNRPIVDGLVGGARTVFTNDSLPEAFGAEMGRGNLNPAIQALVPITRGFIIPEERTPATTSPDTTTLLARARAAFPASPFLPALEGEIRRGNFVAASSALRSVTLRLIVPEGSRAIAGSAELQTALTRGRTAFTEAIDSFDTAFRNNDYSAALSHLDTAINILHSTEYAFGASRDPASAQLNFFRRIVELAQVRAEFGTAMTAVNAALGNGTTGRHEAVAQLDIAIGVLENNSAEFGTSGNLALSQLRFMRGLLDFADRLSTSRDLAANLVGAQSLAPRVIRIPPAEATTRDTTVHQVTPLNPEPSIRRGFETAINALTPLRHILPIYHPWVDVKAMRAQGRLGSGAISRPALARAAWNNAPGIVLGTLYTGGLLVLAGRHQHMIREGNYEGVQTDFAREFGVRLSFDVVRALVGRISPTDAHWWFPGARFDEFGLSASTSAYASDRPSLAYIAEGLWRRASLAQIESGNPAETHGLTPFMNYFRAIPTLSDYPNGQALHPESLIELNAILHEDAPILVLNMHRRNDAWDSTGRHRIQVGSINAALEFALPFFSTTDSHGISYHDERGDVSTGMVEARNLLHWINILDARSNSSADVQEAAIRGLASAYHATAGFGQDTGRALRPPRETLIAAARTRLLGLFRTQDAVDQALREVGTFGPLGNGELYHICSRTILHEQGLAQTPREAMIDTYIRGLYNGTPNEEVLSQMTPWLADHFNIFRFLWSNVHDGHIPVTLMPAILEQAQSRIFPVERFGPPSDLDFLVGWSRLINSALLPNTQAASPVSFRNALTSQGESSTRFPGNATEATFNTTVTTQILQESSSGLPALNRLTLSSSEQFCFRVSRDELAVRVLDSLIADPSVSRINFVRTFTATEQDHAGQIYDQLHENPRGVSLPECIASNALSFGLIGPAIAVRVLAALMVNPVRSRDDLLGMFGGSDRIRAGLIYDQLIFNPAAISLPQNFANRARVLGIIVPSMPYRIADHSFLLAMDNRSQSDPEFRGQVFRHILERYGSNPDAMVRLNQFSIADNDRIYSDYIGIIVLAAMIAEPDISLERLEHEQFVPTQYARVQALYNQLLAPAGTHNSPQLISQRAHNIGMVAPAIFETLYRDIRNPGSAGLGLEENSVLIQFALEHSDLARHTGIVPWLESHQGQIGNLPGLLTYLYQRNRNPTHLAEFRDPAVLFTGGAPAIANAATARQGILNYLVGTNSLDSDTPEHRSVIRINGRNQSVPWFSRPLAPIVETQGSGSATPEALNTSAPPRSFVIGIGNLLAPNAERAAPNPTVTPILNVIDTPRIPRSLSEEPGSIPITSRATVDSNISAEASSGFSFSFNDTRYQTRILEIQRSQGQRNQLAENIRNFNSLQPARRSRALIIAATNAGLQISALNDQSYMGALNFDNEGHLHGVSEDVRAYLSANLDLYITQNHLNARINSAQHTEILKRIYLRILNAAHGAESHQQPVQGVNLVTLGFGHTSSNGVITLTLSGSQADNSTNPARRTNAFSTLIRSAVGDVLPLIRPQAARR